MSAAKRILIADDDQQTLEFMSVALETKGHEVFIADNGMEAIEALKQSPYDYVLLDYHMEGLDGVSSANAMKHGLPDRSCQIIAITGDPEALKARPDSKNIFSQILPKPLDLNRLYKIIYKDDKGFHPKNDNERSELDPVANNLTDTLAASLSIVPNAKNREADSLFNAVLLPRRRALLPKALEGAFKTQANLPADVAFISAEVTTDEIRAFRTSGMGHLIPLIDLSGKAADRADLTIDPNHDDAQRQIKEMVDRFAKNRAELGKNAICPDNDEDRLLAYLFVSDKKLSPIKDLSQKRLYRFSESLLLSDPLSVARRLEEYGFLDKKFIDRHHECPNCHSHRLNVREECPSCDSANIEEVALIHHYRCSYVGPETDFRQGKHLICPKCRQELLHYGSDYDRAGNGHSCHDCDEVSPEPSVGFMCHDCNTHTSGDVINHKDIFEFILNDKGKARVRGAQELVQQFISPFSQALPLLLTKAIARHKVENPNQDGVIIQVSYGNERRIINEFGYDRFNRQRCQFMDNIQQALGDIGVLAQGKDYDYAFLPNAEEDIFKTLQPKIKERGQLQLVDDLDARFETVALSELSL